MRFTREFELASAPAERLVLCFGAVNHTASVRVNGREIGTHAGAWEPFEFDITDAAVTGVNTLEVTVSYPPRFGTPEEPGFLEHPLGKQSWYGTTAGIWQSVLLEERHPVHVRSLSIRSDAATGTISIRGVAAGDADSATVRVLRDDAVITTASLTVQGADISGDVVIAEPELWDIDDPRMLRIPMPAENAQHLVEAELYVGGELLARDAADILVVARDPWTGGAVRAGDAEIAQWLGELEVPVSDDSELLVVRSFTDVAQQHARSGGRVLLLAEEDGAFGAAFDYLPSARLTSRAGDGDWVLRTEWLDRRGAFSEVPGDTILGIASEDLLGDDQHAARARGAAYGADRPRRWPRTPPRQRG